MFLATFLIGLREGLEASLVIGILLACVTKVGRSDARPKIWWGVGIATTVSLIAGAILTYGRYGLSFEGQELLGGGLSLLAVLMVTTMVFWMAKIGPSLKQELEASARAALATGSGWAMFWLAAVTVGREGLETTLMLWAWSTAPQALAGAVVGILLAVTLGVVINRGMMKFNLSRFFAVTGALLIVMSAGILAYGIHDLQEARFLPGPFSGAPITPTNFRTGEVLVGFTTTPFWGASFPFGWAFDLQNYIDPSGTVASILKGTVGFTPLMSWLEVIAWALYLTIVFPLWMKQQRRATPAESSKS